MSLLDEALAQRLERRRLWPRWAAPTASEGERRGSAIGSGMEFADHREYYAGDDLRHLDPHAYARLGRPYLKRFAADRALDVAILVDVSASMDYGQPSKLQVASRLAAALAYVAVSSGDRVRIASFGGGDEVRWRPAITSARHVSAVVENLEEPHAHTRAESDLAAVARKVRAMLSSSGMTVVLSDWWTPAPEAAIRAFARSGREAVAVQILAPEEEDPRLLADGPARLTDAERGESLDVYLDGDVQAAYERGLEDWRLRFREAVNSVRGQFLTVRSDRPVATVLLDDWRKAGFMT